MKQFLLFLCLTAFTHSADALTIQGDNLEITFTFKMKVVRSGRYDSRTGKLVSAGNDLGDSFTREFSFSTDPEVYYGGPSPRSYFYASFNGDRFYLESERESIAYNFTNRTGRIDCAILYNWYVNQYDFFSDGTGRYWKEDDGDPTFLAKEATLKRLTVSLVDVTTGDIVALSEPVPSNVPLPAGLPLLISAIGFLGLRRRVKA